MSTPLDCVTFEKKYNYYFQVNKSLPLNYDFEFVVEEITNINDKGSLMQNSKYSTSNDVTQIPTTDSSCHIEANLTFQF